jgi:hypothetical protein
MNYTYNTVCTAHISVNKNRVKIYQNSSGKTVFLKDGQNFEIELYNPKQNNVLAKISINGNDISTSGFILKPGQRVFIERFIDEAKKFTFSTYEVDDTSKNREAIANNGEVEVRFYDEYVPQTIFTNNYGTTITTNPCWTTSPTYIYSNGNVGIGCSSPSTTLNISGSTSTYYSNSNATFTSSNSIPVAGSLETGRVERGGSSSQSFTSAFGNFNSWASSTETIKIYPISQKPVESSEIRNYCTNCGARAKKTGWKFCPSCGSKF